uniref:Uncharacterized protein n=1 Tax=Anguilla anguilla TaxID=7936 RepID=A0A0E9PL08_ANGAN
MFADIPIGHSLPISA